jgi:membrane protease YdiL (CAAX protease family)
MSPKTALQKFLHFPLTKIIFGIVVCLGIAALGQMLSQRLLTFTALSPDYKNLAAAVIGAVLLIAAYCGLFGFYEKRRISEFYGPGIARNILVGTLLGALLQSLTILVMYLSGAYSVLTVNTAAFLIPPLVMAFSSAIFEEILLRGIVFRIMEEKLGSYLALAISALIFGALHLANPNSSVAAALGLAIQAGLLLGAAYMYSRSLWLPIAIHFAWNFTQSAVFGAAVSGNKVSKTWITSSIEGPEWLTGGGFGPEGSIQATLFCSVATVVFLVLCYKQKKIIHPYWKISHEPLQNP